MPSRKGAYTGGGVPMLRDLGVGACIVGQRTAPVLQRDRCGRGRQAGSPAGAGLQAIYCCGEGQAEAEERSALRRGGSTTEGRPSEKARSRRGARGWWWPEPVWAMEPA